MSKNLESLKTLKDMLIGNGVNDNINDYVDNLILPIKQALNRLEAIDNANPSEALELVDKMANYILLDEEYGFIDEKEKQAIIKDRDIIKQALLKAQQPKQYKWENLEFKNKQCIEYKVLLNGVEYYMFVCDEDEEKYDSLSKYVMLSRVKVVNEMGKPVKGHEFFDCIEADKQFFNDLRLERVDEE